MSVSIDTFLEFEKKSNIFSIKNDNGIYLWDIFRYYVRGRLGESYSPVVRNHNNRRNLSWVFNCFISLIKTIWFVYIDKTKYLNLFFLASRNQYKDSFIDQNQFDIYKALNEQKNLLIETCGQRDYKFYKEKPLQHYNLTRMAKLLYIKKISSSDKKCINEIYELLENGFYKLPFTEEMLISLLKTFYRDIYLWKKILKNHAIDRIFLTQNGIQKGFFYVAKQLNIPLYEFQHGIIGKSHAAYSYPEIIGIEKYIYMPNKFLTLSDYWCKSFFCPMPNQVIGNNYFSKPVVKIVNPEKILVISADVFGKQLAEFLKEAINTGILDSHDLIFKLHPNQYYEKQYFIDFFEGKVSVLTDEKSVNSLLSESKSMITVCSTASYEALQANTRVLIYTISMYKEMQLIFEDKNVFLFSNIDELKIGLQADLPLDYKTPVFFDKCTPEKIKAAIDE